VPSWSPPTGYPKQVCSNAALTAMLTDCSVVFDGPTCLQDQAAFPTCAACVFTPYTAPVLGPLITVGDLIQVNVGGCVAIATGDTSASACGATLGLAAQCVREACAGCANPVPEGGLTTDGGTGDLPAFQACATAAVADGAPCAAQSAAIAKNCPSQLPASYDACLPTQSEAQGSFVFRLVGFFCGGTGGQ
jgi:hypothetical protein